MKAFRSFFQFSLFLIFNWIWNGFRYSNNFFKLNGRDKHSKSSLIWIPFWGEYLDGLGSYVMA
jgi:hypothetical protein